MNLWFDFKYAWRLMLKSPGHSMVCVIVVALSVGQSLGCFVIDYCIAFKPLPFPDAHRWISVQVAADGTSTAHANLDAYTYQELLKQTRSVDQLGAFTTQAAVLSDGQASTSARAAAISPSLLTAMHVAPLSGRIFEASDSEAGAAPVVILSFDTWQTHFAADPAIVGKQAQIDGQPKQIIGVMPKDFFAFKDFELWFPLQLTNLARPGDTTMRLSPIVRLADGQNADAVLNQLKPV